MFGLALWREARMSQAWRSIESWVGREISAANVSETTIQTSWSVATGLVLLIWLTSSALIWLAYWRERTSAHRGWKLLLATMRTVVVALVISLLYGWTAQRHSTDRADLVIVLDDSASMELADAYDSAALAAQVKQRLSRLKLDEPTRLNLAKTLLLENDAALLAELGRLYHLRFYLAGKSARALAYDDAISDSSLREVSASQSSSRLGDCLRDVLDAQRGRPTAAIIFLTDGVTTEGQPLPAAAQYARRKAVPLYLVGLGSDRLPRDLRLTDLLADEAAFVGDWLSFEVNVRGESYSGAAGVRLKRIGASDTLAEQTIALDGAATNQTVRLDHRADAAGEFEYVIEVVPQAGEVNLDNNRLTHKVIVREETIRVLLVQAYPSYEFRFLKQVLVRELNAEQPADARSSSVRTVLQEADQAYVETDITAERTFPVGREELLEYDVLILGDVNPALLSPSIMNNIHEFVTVRGGGLIFIAGPRYMPLAYQDTPLAPLFPMSLDTVTLPESAAPITEEFRPRLTPLGLANPALQLADRRDRNEPLWRDDLTPLRWFARIPDLRPGVRVLAEHPETRSAGGRPLPMICLHFSGAGKVLFHATDETHRWRFRVGDVYFARYWVQAIRALCRAQRLAGNRTVELTTDHQRYRGGEPVSLRVRFLDDRQAPDDDSGVSVVVQRDGGERRTIVLHRHSLERGVFEASAGPLGSGRYRAWLATPTLEAESPVHEFAVIAPPGELSRTQMEASELRAAAKISGGQFYTFATASRLLADLPRGRQVRLESLPPTPIWNSPLVAALFVSLLTAEWLLRKRAGLL